MLENVNFIYSISSTVKCAVHRHWLTQVGESIIIQPLVSLLDTQLMMRGCIEAYTTSEAN